MFGFSRKNKRGDIDVTHNTTSMENIINSMTPPPQIVEVNQVMPITPSPAAAAAPSDSGSSSSVPTGALVASNADEQVQLQQTLYNSPESYVGPLSEQPELDEVMEEFHGVAIIDWSCTDKALFARQVREACRSGCYLVINFGVSWETIEETKAKAKEAFGSSFFGSDYYRKDEYPYMKLRRSYCKEFNPLIYKMLEVVSESLGLEGDDYSWKVQGDGHIGQHLAMNYYPPWTEPGLTRGVLQAGHTDPNAFTIHLLDQESAAGMQIFRRGRWIDVEPHPGALLITIGDKIEALSKGKYKSARYRMTVSPDKERISRPGSFCCRGGNATSTPGPSTGKTPAVCI